MIKRIPRLKSLLFQVLEMSDRDREKESNKCKLKEKKLMETEELNFLLQSGIVLCKLAATIVPETDIVIEQLQVDIKIKSIFNLCIYIYSVNMCISLIL